MFDLKLDGLDEAKELLDTIAAIGNMRPMAELNALDRHDDPGTSNAQVLQWLAEGGRNFVVLSDQEQSELAQTLADVLFIGLVRKGGLAAVKSSDKAQQQARAITARAFKRAAEYWQKRIMYHIGQGEWVGDGDNDLSEPYGESKENEVGFKLPIGIKSGQVIANLNPGTGPKIRFKSQSTK